MSTVHGPKWPFYSCWDYIGLLVTGFMQVFHLGRAPRTKETLPDFLKWRRITRHPLVFRRLTGSQRTPGFWGVTYKLIMIEKKNHPSIFERGIDLDIFNNVMNIAGD